MNSNNEDLANKNVKVFTTYDEIFGLPSTVFICGFLFSILMSVTVIWWSGFIIGTFYFLLLYKLYSLDPKALQVLKRNLFRKHYYWVSGRTNNTTIKYL